MAKKKAAPITNLDRARLLKCPYVYNATKHSIAFTEEGKRRIWEGLLSGKSCVRVLLEDLGLPPVDHVYDIAKRLPHVLKRELQTKGSFERKSQRAYGGLPIPGDEAEKARMEELLLKEQELEFLKKITRKANGQR